MTDTDDRTLDDAPCELTEDERHAAEVERLKRFGYDDADIDKLLKDWA